MVKNFILLLFALLAVDSCYGQTIDSATIFHLHSAHTSFPDTGREKGHLYEHVLYTAAAHYHDSTVLIIAPPHLDAKKRVDIVFWFHGWGNHVDSAAGRYELTKQFIESHRNAVLVLAETAKNAPDSYGGKLENTGEFRLLVNDVMAGLKERQIIAPKCAAGNVLLAGHSGAYRVMAYIVQNGGVPISQVILFDALYSQTDKFMKWLTTNSKARFIDLYTDHGGTDGESHKMVGLLKDAQITYVEAEETDVTPRFFMENNIVFIHSTREHNDIINQPDNFKLMLENTRLLKAIKAE